MLSVASCSGIGIRKRKNEQDYDDPDGPGIKVSKSDFYIMLESESDIPSSATEDTESVLSIQNKSTDFAKDTSDTSSKMSYCESDLESLVGVEYEPMTPSEHDQDHPFDSYSSGADSDLWKKSLGELSVREDNSASAWAEADYSSDASDEEFLPTTLRSRLRTCVKCKTVTNHYQYCDQCYKARKDFFPARPKRYKKKGLKPFFKKRTYLKELKSLPWKESQGDSGVESTSNREQILIPTMPDNGLCNLCYTNPKDGAFIHCHWVHVYSCYQCSLRCWFEQKRCPICKSKIRQVLKMSME